MGFERVVFDKKITPSWSKMVKSEKVQIFSYLNIDGGTLMATLIRKVAKVEN